MDSIFNRLYSYRATEGRNPEEDFFTEVFAGVMEKTQGFFTTLLNKWINDIQRGKGLNPIELSELKIKTQANYSSSIKPKESNRPDIVIRANERSAENKLYTIFIENKIGSTERNNQLKSYAQQLNNLPTEGKVLIYITRYPEQKDSNDVTFENIIFVQKRWFEVYRDAVNYRKHNSSQFEIVYLDELIKFMEEKKMALKLSLFDLALTQNAKQNERKYQDILNEAINKSLINQKIKDKAGGSYSYNFTPEVIELGTHFFTKDKYRLSIGFWFNHDNRPNIFNECTREVPVLFINLLKPAEEINTSLNQNKRIDELTEKYDWEWVNDKKFHWFYFTKALRLENVHEKDNLADYFIEEICKGLDELYKALFQ